MDAVEQKLRDWIIKLPLLKENQIYCVYWAETGPDDTISTDPTCMKFYKSREQILTYLLDIYCYEDDTTDDIVFFDEEKHESGWDVFIATVEPTYLENNNEFTKQEDKDGR